MVNVAIRADGSPSMGMGHIMRCLSLAKAFACAGCKVIFFTKYESGLKAIKNAGFEAHQLHSAGEGTGGLDYGTPEDLKDELREVIPLIEKNLTDVFIVDSYNVNEEYFHRLRENVRKLVYIDDVNKFTYPVDVLINGNITGKYLDYKKYRENEVLLTGPEYNLIRDEFQGISRRVINRDAKEIMVTTGGSDPYNTCFEIAGSIAAQEEFAGLAINIVVGSGFHNKLELQELGKLHKNIVLHENVKAMSEIMLRSDMAISAGGSTVYELCACGTPALAVILADNQEFITRKMDELGYLESLGWYNSLNTGNWMEKFKKMYGDYEKRSEMSAKMQGLVDGKGAQRAVDAILTTL